MYGELVSREPSWVGKLVVSAGAGAAASGLGAATALAGGCCLLIDADKDAVRGEYRDGGVDFVVNTLDEALRVLKNELRQARPLVVALNAEVAPSLSEMGERGVLADLAVNATGVPANEHLQLGERPTDTLKAWLLERDWHEQAVEHPMELTLAAEDPRFAWVRGIARYQRSASRERRVLWLSSAELLSYSSRVL